MYLIIAEVIFLDGQKTKKGKYKEVESVRGTGERDEVLHECLDESAICNSSIQRVHILSSPSLSLSIYRHTSTYIWSIVRFVECELTITSYGQDSGQNIIYFIWKKGLRKKKKKNSNRINLICAYSSHFVFEFPIFKIR